ncbi:MAG: hypothetical protein QXG39_00245 [Candidatus Aenigmatarchaeota archaeon]
MKTILLDLGGDENGNPRIGVYVDRSPSLHNPGRVDIKYVKPGLLNALKYLFFKKCEVIKNVNPEAIEVLVANDETQYMVLISSEDGKAPFLGKLGYKKLADMAETIRRLELEKEEIDRVAERKIRIASSREDEVLRERARGLKWLMAPSEKRKPGLPLLERIEEEG